MLKDEAIETDDEEEEPDEEELEGAEPEVTVPPEQVESSLDELLAKKEKPEAEAAEADEDTLLSSSREEKLESLAVKVVPQQPTEFTCRNCFLVKHRSQLANKKRMLCRDCA